MFSQPVRPYEGTTTTVNARNMVEKSAAHWSRPIYMVLQHTALGNLEADINLYLSDPRKHVVSLETHVSRSSYGFAYTAVVIYQERNEAFDV